MTDIDAEQWPEQPQSKRELQARRAAGVDAARDFYNDTDVDDDTRIARFLGRIVGGLARSSSSTAVGCSTGGPTSWNGWITILFSGPMNGGLMAAPVDAVNTFRVSAGRFASFRVLPFTDGFALRR